jgi:hypothetical protein
LYLDRLKELLDYDPATGVFTWRGDRHCNKVGGRVAGTIHKAGYRTISIDNRPYLAHRLAWLWMTGEWPKLVDHIDMNKSNNSWSNLRAATKSQNNAHTKGHGAKSGVKGVWYWADRGVFQAKVKNKTVGYFATKEEAGEAFRIAAREVYGEYAI